MYMLRCGLALMCLAALGCSSAQTGAVRVDAALAGLVPADTVTLAGVRLDALRATPIYQKWIAGKPLLMADEFAKETGLDLRKDVSELLVASNGKDTVALARGKFSPTALDPKLAGMVAFINSTTAVAGPPAVVRAVVDRRNPSGVPAALLAKVSTISAQNQIWAVSLGGFSQIASAVPPAGPMASLGKILSMLEDLTLAADLRSGVNAAVTGLCKTEQDARSLSDALRGLIGLGRLSTPNNEPEMLRLYDGIQVEQQQRTVRVRAQIPQDLLDKAIGKVAALSEGSPPPRRR